MDLLNSLLGLQSEYGDLVSKYQLLFTALIVPTLLIIPRVFNWLTVHCKNFLFITIVVDESDNVTGVDGFKYFMNWLTERRIEWASRTFEVVSSPTWFKGRRLPMNEYSLRTGLGKQFFKFDKGFYMLEVRRREPTGNSTATSGVATITTFRWNRSALPKLIAESTAYVEVFEPCIQDEGVTTVIPAFYGKQRQLVSRESYNKMKDVFERYVGNEVSYSEMMRAFKEVVILYGPPGTGKTNLVRHFAVLYQMDIVIVKPGAFSKDMLRQGRGQSLYRNGVIYLIEDIDSNPNFCGDPGNRKLSEQVEEVDEDYGEVVMVDRGDRGSLSELINGLDGVKPLDRAIVIMSTNRPDLLNPNIYREGRVDEHIALEYLPLDETIDYLGWGENDERTQILINSEVAGKIPAAGILRLKRCESTEAVVKSIEQTKLVKSLKNYQQAA